MSRDSAGVLDAMQLSILEGHNDELAQSLHPDAEEEAQVSLSAAEEITQPHVSSTPSHALSAAPEPEELISGALSGPDRVSRLPNVILFHWLPPNGPKKGKPHLSLAFRQPHQEQYDYVSFGYVSSNRESMSARNRLQAFWERPGVLWDWLQAFGEEFQLHWRPSKFSKFYSEYFYYCKRWKYECRLYSLDEHVTDIQGLREVRDRLFTMPAYHLIFQNCSTVVLELLAKGGMKDISFHPRQRLYILLFSLFMGHALFHEFTSFYDVYFTQSPKMSVTDALSGLFFHRWIKKLFVNANSIFLSKAKLERSVDETLAPALLTGAFSWVFSYALSKRLGFSPRIFSRENALQHALITPLVSLYSVAIMMRITVPGFWRIEEGSVYNKLHSMLYDLLDWNLDLTEPYATKALLFFLSKPIAIWSIYSTNSKIKEKAIPLLHRIVVSSTFFPFLALFGGWYLIKTTVTPNFVISTLPRSVRLTDEEFRQVRDTDKWQPLPPPSSCS